MHSRSGLETYTNAVAHLKQIGAEILTGGSRYTEGPFAAGNYVQPTIAIPNSTDTTGQVWAKETFAPILNVAVSHELPENFLGFFRHSLDL
jgi:aldehyde dehydrogenase family 7 protein A1